MLLHTGETHIHTTQHYTTTHNNTQQHTTTHNNTQQHTTTHNNTQQHTTTHNNYHHLQSSPHIDISERVLEAKHWIFTEWTKNKSFEEKRSQTIFVLLFFFIASFFSFFFFSHFSSLSFLFSFFPTYPRCLFFLSLLEKGEEETQNQILYIIKTITFCFPVPQFLFS
ncbi:hypothetical protein QBC44DRAFT_36111 [Cladorrhinum sp. PSN332]|nr:hypothetical protein QBC44DRAFT_36111 [Cladorrhinum sp. PSN332]